MKVVSACAIVTIATLIFLAAAVARDPKPVAIHVNPRVLMAGSAFWLTCTVPRDARNRELAYGVVDFRDSRRQLDGDSAPITYQTLIEHVPCAVGPAYCAIRRNDGTGDQAIQDFQIASCDP